MASPLEGSIRRAIGKALKSTFYAAKITRTEVIGGVPWDPSQGETVITDYVCRAMVDGYSVMETDGARIQTGDVKIVILTDTLAIEPTTTDTVSIRGKTYTIINIGADPARATWIIQARS